MSERRILCGLYDLTSKACLAYELLTPSEWTRRNQSLHEDDCNCEWQPKAA